MTVPKDAHNLGRAGPGAPLTSERERYLRLVAQGMSNVDACREVGVHRITGTRWRDGRKMIDSGGHARYYAPIASEPVVISARFLSEDERVQIGDLLRAGQTIRAIAASHRQCCDVDWNPPRRQLISFGLPLTTPRGWARRGGRRN